VPSYINKLDIILIYFFGVSILMYKQIPFVITASILLTGFLTIVLYTGSQTVHAAVVVIKHPGLAKLAIAAAAANMTNATAAGGNMTSSNATAAAGGGNMTSSNATAAAGGGNMTSSNATAAAGGGNMSQPLVPPKQPSS
jgi:hypothetical protein